MEPSKAIKLYDRRYNIQLQNRPEWILTKTDLNKYKLTDEELEFRRQQRKSKHLRWARFEYQQKLHNMRCTYSNQKPIQPSSAIITSNKSQPLIPHSSRSNSSSSIEKRSCSSISNRLLTESFPSYNNTTTNTHRYPKLTYPSASTHVRDKSCCSSMSSEDELVWVKFPECNLQSDQLNSQPHLICTTSASSDVDNLLLSSRTQGSHFCNNLVKTQSRKEDVLDSIITQEVSTTADCHSQLLSHNPTEYSYNDTDSKQFSSDPLLAVSNSVQHLRDIVSDINHCLYHYA